MQIICWNQSFLQGQNLKYRLGKVLGPEGLSDYKHLKTSILKRTRSCKEAIKLSVRGFTFSVQLMPGAGLLLSPQENRSHWNGNTDITYQYINIFRSPCWEELNKLKPKLISCDFFFFFTSDCRCWITTVNASNFWFPLIRNFFSCRMIPLWVSHFALYCVNSAVFVPGGCTSVEAGVCTQELLGLRCLPLSTKTTTTTTTTTN